MKQRLFEIFDVPQEGDSLSRWFDIFLVTLISLNVLAVVVGTVANIADKYERPLWWFEVISVIVFTTEYLGRVWTANLNPKYSSPVLGRIRFMLSPLALVDLLAILPFYLPMLIAVDLRFLRALRLIRIFRIFKVGRYSDEMAIFGRVLRKKKEELVITAFAGFLILLIASSLMYYIEGEESYSQMPFQASHKRCGGAWRPLRQWAMVMCTQSLLLGNCLGPS